VRAVVHLCYALSYRKNLEEMMLETGLTVDHTTVLGVGLRPELDKRCRVHLKPTNDSWRLDETYIEVKESGNISTGLWILKATL